MSFEYRKLRGKIVEKFGNQGNFARALGVSENTVSRKLSGSKVSFSRENIVQWCKLLDIDLKDVGEYFFC